MRCIILCAAVLAILPSGSATGQPDADAYRAARGIEEPVERVEALKAFIAGYPESRGVRSAQARLFETYLEMGDIAAATEAGEAYLATLPAGGRHQGYNRLAWTLAEEAAALDSADAYATRAVAWARETKSRRLAMYLDTHAYVRYKMGRAADAVIMQREAMPGHETDPGFLLRLGMYEAGNGNLLEAMRVAGQAILHGDNNQAVDDFRSWAERKAPDPTVRASIQKQIVTGVVDSFLARGVGAGKLDRQSRAAVLMAHTGVSRETAERWADAAVASIGPGTSTGSVVQYHRAQALVRFSLGRHAEALKSLKGVENLISPWDAGTWYLLGQIHEKLGAPDKAVDAYIQGLLMGRPEKLADALESVYAQVHGDAGGIPAAIDSAKEAKLTFSPNDQPAPPAPTGRAVLAELFTGAECPPCVAADYAFDALAEHYPRETLAILEYHLHIPGPDPMTNADTEARRAFYGRFGTPTVFLNGTEKITGGGPRMAVANRYAIYDRAIRRHLTYPDPGVTISGGTRRSGDTLEIKLSIESKPLPDSTRLYVSLVERSVDYVGRNEVAHHLFVVRKLVGGADGIVLDTSDGSADVGRTIDLAGVESELAAYLDAYAETNASRLPSGAWKSRPYRLDRKNLAVVAWVQDAETKAVLQAYYVDI